MAEYKMVFSDIDGTLLNSEGVITEDTARAIGRLQNAGTPFVLVSSRPPFGLSHLHEELKLNAPTICYGGSLVMDKESALHEAPLLGQDGLYVVETAARFWPEVCCTLSTIDRWIVDDLKNPWVILENKVTGIVPTQGNVRGVLASGETVYKMLCMGEPEEIAALEELLEREGRVSAKRSKPIYLEITARGVCKSSAIRFLCDAKGISAEETVSFGDNFNDADMLEHTGLSFAMGNAPDAIKQIASRVTHDNDHDGIARALEDVFGV